MALVAGRTGCRSLLRRVSHKVSLCAFSSSNDNNDQQALFREQMKALQEERDELFGFTTEEKNSWTDISQSNAAQHADFLQQIQEARSELDDSPTTNVQSTSQRTNLDENVDRLTHLSKDGSTIQMVNVADKAVTKRSAVAHTRVILPPNVTRALNIDNESKDIVGKKGPVFETARIAGIMAAKKTSDLIPLCHPLPLEQVQIDIEFNNGCTDTLDDGTSVIDIYCECRVTHKTGVEMEALTGASVAALCIYDMVKAISHDVQIQSTRLVSKTGGKRTVNNDRK